MFPEGCYFSNCVNTELCFQTASLGGGLIVKFLAEKSALGWIFYNQRQLYRERRAD